MTPAAAPPIAKAPALQPNWLLVVRATEDGLPVRWLLCDGTRCHEGTAPQMPSEQTAALTALLEGLRALSHQQRGQVSELTVVSNAKSVVALANGRPGAQSEADKRLLRTIGTMCSIITKVSFLAMRIEALDELIEGLPREPQ